MEFSFTKVFYEYWEQDDVSNCEDGNTYNEDYDKPLITKDFESIDKAIEYAKRGILKKGHNINEIDDISENNDIEIVIFYGEDIIKDGIRFERAIKIENNDHIAVNYTLKSLLVNGA